jgi:probable phosphoglycerate mutase
MVLDRVRQWLPEVSVPTLAVTHRGVIRVILAAATGWDMRGKPPVKLDWRAVHLFELDERGRLQLA